MRKNLEHERSEDWWDNDVDALLEDYSQLMAGLLALISAILSIIALCIMKRKYNFEYLRTRKQMLLSSACCLFLAANEFYYFVVDTTWYRS